LQEREEFLYFFRKTGIPLPLVILSLCHTTNVLTPQKQFAMIWSSLTHMDHNMTHAELIKACKDAERAAMRQADHTHPGQAQQLSSRYLVVEPFIPFGDYLWDNSMREFLWILHRAQDRLAEKMYVTGVVNVAKEKHRFAINQYTPNAATWRVDIDINDDRVPSMRSDDLREILWK
jgi:hypothetical protein